VSSEIAAWCDTASFLRIQRGCGWYREPGGGLRRLEHGGVRRQVEEEVDGTWDKIFAAVLADANAEGRIDWSMVSVDSTACRAHQHAAGARKRPPARSTR
jgi:hypothetical protein